MSSYLDFFSHAEAAQIMGAIEESEKKTSGEIRVHIEDFCNNQVMDRAAYIFNKLGMQNTKERNGVLFYISVKDRDFAVLGDVGIHDKLSEDYWRDMCSKMESEFRHSNFVKGLVDAINKAADSLTKYFPLADDDLNELSDEISIGQI